MKSIQNIIACSFVLLTSVSYSQTINIGELTITPGTQMSTLGALDNKTTGDLINDGELFVYSHYNNDGLVSFTTGNNSGMTRMIGTSGFQNISGSILMEWYDCEFNNITIQPAFHLSNHVSIANQAEFNNGVVDDDNFNGLLIFEDDATYSNVSDNSHVDGYVLKNGDDSFMYPIGDGGQFRYAGISAPNSSSDAFTGKYFLEDSNPLCPHPSKVPIIQLIDNAEYWTVEKTSSTSDIFLTLTWDTDTTPPAIYASPEDEIHIVRWDDTQNLWVDEGGVANVTTREVTTVIDPLTGYGVFTLARVDTSNILPCGGRGVVVYNAVSPDDDGLNDYFIIDGIDACPQNRVSIYNRWGAKVFETEGYNTSNNVFKGISEADSTINESKKLPTGTYFYVIDFLDENGGIRTKKAGYLYLNNN